MASRLVRRASSTGTLSSDLFAILILSSAFVIGALCGFFFALFCGERTELSAYLGEYFSFASGDSGLSFSLWSIIWDVVRWPLLAYVLGAVRFGVVGIPILLSARGFLLSHAISVFAITLGSEGLLAALVVFGVSALLTIPPLFAISCDSFRSTLSRTQAKSDAPIFSAKRLSVLLPCSGVMALAIILQRSVMPSLLSVVSIRLFPV